MKRCAKRIFDLTTSLVALFFLMPILALLSLAILFIDGAPVFFLQERVCENHARFWLWKFRTMRHEDGLRVTSNTDPRTTKLGAILRKFRIDELPQLVQVVTGRMSLVGPRPEVPFFVDPASPQQNEVLSVKPGLVDPAVIDFLDEEQELGRQVDPETYYREEILPKKLEASCIYLRQANFWTDLSVIVKALKRLAWRRIS